MLTILFILIAAVSFSSKKLILVYQRDFTEAKLSADRVENKFKQLYPGINIVKPLTSSEINNEILNTKETELIFFFIGHSNPMPDYAVDQYGKLMMYLTDFAGGSRPSYDKYKEKLYLSSQLIKSLKSITAKKIVIIDGCYSELAYTQIPKTTWLFSCSKDQVNISIDQKGSVFVDYLVETLSYNVTISDISNGINKGIYSDKAFYDNAKPHPDYKFVKDNSTYEKPYKSKYYGEYVF